jgi:hypothetical protein
MESTAMRIVRLILENLKRRGGLVHGFDAIDDNVSAEMYRDLVEIVEGVLE